MMRIFMLCLILLISCKNASLDTKTHLQGYEHPIDYIPAYYLCHYTIDPPFIDGKLDDSVWKDAEWTETFQDIEGALKPAPFFETKVKMLWDSNYLYFAAMLEEKDLWATLKNRDDIIFHDNNFEIFLDPDGDTHNYFEFEVNALNTIWDLFLMRPYREFGGHKTLNDWNMIDFQSAVYLDGTLNQPNDNDNFWSVEIALPMSTLIETARGHRLPKDGEYWRVNFSRVEWDLDKTASGYVKRTNAAGKNLAERNWCWSPSGKVNMHQPETWGFVQFASFQSEQKLEKDPLDPTRWAMRKLYYLQRSYFQNEKKYPSKLDIFALDPLLSDGIYEATSQSYMFSVDVRDITLILREDGSVVRKQ